MLFTCFLLIQAYSLRGNSYGYDTKKIPRFAEGLDRGLVVINTQTDAFLSWRFLITDDDDIAFNVYRREENCQFEKLNTELITKATIFRDKSIDKTKNNEYFVESIVKGKSVENSTLYLLQANTPNCACYKIGLHKGCYIKTVWVGDLNGDGKFDFVIARNCVDAVQSIEAYLSDGTYLWNISLGHNSEYQYYIEPGSTAINVGHLDGVNIYDLDGDGKGEVYLRIANNVTFGDGYVFRHENDDQFIASIDGMTGKLIGLAEVPSDFMEFGPRGPQFGIGYLDGKKPSLVACLINRDNPNYEFHEIVAAYNYDYYNNSAEKVFGREWYWPRKNCLCAEAHQFRIIDVERIMMAKMKLSILDLY